VDCLTVLVLSLMCGLLRGSILLDVRRQADDMKVEILIVKAIQSPRPPSGRYLWARMVRISTVIEIRISERLASLLRWPSRSFIDYSLAGATDRIQFRRGHHTDSAQGLTVRMLARGTR
jgi:hypothetical protein